MIHEEDGEITLRQGAFVHTDHYYTTLQERTYAITK